MARGRQTKLTPAMQDRICSLLQKGVPRMRAARLAGIDETTFCLWMNKGSAATEGIHFEFSKAVSMAEDLLVERAIAVIVDIFDGEAGAEPSTRMNAAKFLLSHRFPQDFSTRAEVRNTGHDGGPIKVEGKIEADVTVRPLVSNEQLAEMTPEQLAATIGALVTRPT